MIRKEILGLFLFCIILCVEATPLDDVSNSEMTSINITEDIILEMPDEEKVFKCSVGLRGGRIPNSAFSSSSYYSHATNGYCYNYLGRLDNVPVHDGAPRCGCWRTSSNSVAQWLQVDLESPRWVTGVVTQGRPGMVLHEFVSTFEIQYGNSTGQLVTIREDGEDVIFHGNIDTNSHVFNYFPKPIRARYFRLVVQSWSDAISLRMDYLTC